MKVVPSNSDRRSGMQKLLSLVSALAFFAVLLPTHSAIYKEAGGRVVVEAENFALRTTNSTDAHHWHLVPDENAADPPADAGFANARGGKYMQSEPDSLGGGQNKNADVSVVGTDPYMEYKVEISNPGNYRLWMRWGGYDGSSDSIYAQIMELKAPAGPGPDWYRYVGNINLDFNGSWNGSGAPSTDTANRIGGGGGEIPAIWTIATAGTYTIRISQREDGSAVDTIMLQLENMPPPTDPGPPESSTTTTADTTPPTITEARTSGNPNGVFVLFSEAVSPSTATNKNNYAIDNGVVVNSASAGPNNFTILLTTTTIAPGKVYQLTVNNVQDTASTPNTIAANSKAQFLQVDGIIERRVFLNINGGAVADLTNAAKFMNNQPDQVTYPTSLEGPVNFADNYGTQFRGYVTAPASGDYVFFLCSDDNSFLYLSSDESPANKQPIAAETAWSNSREWISTSGNGDLTAKRSDQYVDTGWPTGNTITLTAGKRYYIEVLQKEGGGGDDVAVTWQLPGAAEPVNGAEPIPGKYLSAFGFTPGPVGIGTPPASQSVQEPGPATFTVQPSGTAPYTYQWFRNGVAIPGATAQSYTLPNSLRSDNGARFTVRVSNSFSSATSGEATLTVVPDLTAPQPFQVTSVSAGFKTLTLSFNELMDKASAERGANYLFTPGNITASNVVMDATRTNVTITTASPLTPGVTNTLTLSGVQDLAGNPVGTGTGIQFIFNPVTYAANILFDHPIAYYQFEEPAGATIATNAGTTGAAGDGLYVSDSGGGGPAKGEAGPRPATFAGFDANNRAATFDGVGDWVNTQNQFLDGLGAFSLEYWVKPADRANQGTRIGIVGQNDAIEYGFIDQNTIQIWTPNGGSLNTAYSFPDNEWHHVATIADGTSLKTYYDGVLAGTGGSATANYGNSSFNVNIGGGGVFDGSGNFFPGQIDEVAIFTNAIPAARIAGHFKAGKEGGVLVTSGQVISGGPGIRLGVSVSGGNVVINWSPTGGMLQSTPALTGASTVWTDLGTANPMTVTIGTGNRFYRVKSP